MSDRILCEFYIIRYVPDVVRGEFVNIGVILRQLREDGSTSADDVIVRFTRDWARVRCLDPDADIELLESLEAEFADRLVEVLPASPADIDDLNDLFADVDERYMRQYAVTRVLAEFSNALSNSIQITERCVSLAQSVPLEIEQLMKMYVAPRPANAMLRGATLALKRELDLLNWLIGRDIPAEQGRDGW